MNASLMDTTLGPLYISLALGLAVLLAGWGAGVLILRRDNAHKRIAALVKDRGQPASGLDHIKRAALGLMSHLAGPARPKQDWQESRLRRDLMLAGYRGPAAFNVFLGIRVLCVLAAPVLVLISPLMGRLQGPFVPLALAGAGVLGYLVPGIVLDARSRARRDRIGRELPDVLDLMVISVEAGLGLDATIKRVSQDVRISAPVLASELCLVALELKAGIARPQALKNLATRCGVDEVSSLVTMLNQADRFGVSVARSLRVHSDSVRTKRRQKAEEAAAKVPLKLLFPVLFMIFPAIMAVMAGPALIRVAENLIK